jgi:hypothetical protein
MLVSFMTLILWYADNSRRSLFYWNVFPNNSLVTTILTSSTYIYISRLYTFVCILVYTSAYRLNVRFLLISASKRELHVATKRNIRNLAYIVILSAVSSINKAVTARCSYCFRSNIENFIYNSF